MLTFSDSFSKATEAIDAKTTNWNSSKFIACHMSGYVTTEPLVLTVCKVELGRKATVL